MNKTEIDVFVITSNMSVKSLNSEECATMLMAALPSFRLILEHLAGGGSVYLCMLYR